MIPHLPPYLILLIAPVVSESRFSLLLVGLGCMIFPRAISSEPGQIRFRAD